MPWVRLDDGFADHPKIEAAGPSAAWLHVAALCYCARHLTDGRVPKGKARRLTDIPSPTKHIDVLLAVGLWHEDGDDYLIHDYLDYQPSRADTEREREAARERMANARRNKGRSSAEQPPNVPLNGEGSSRNGRSGNPIPSLSLTKTQPSNRTPEPMLTVVPDAVSPPATVPSDVQVVFDAWRESAGKTDRTKLDKKRKRVIQNALKDYPLDDLLAAVRGWKRSPHHRGENPSSTVYNSLDLLLRDAEHIEKFRDLELNQQPQAAGGEFSQPSFRGESRWT